MLIEDYILIAVDPNSRFAIRFLCLHHELEASLKLHRIDGDLQPVYAKFLMGSVLLGSRSDEQESSLFKLKLEQSELTINCEVSPFGVFRSAVFPFANKSKFNGQVKGELKVIQQLKQKQSYQSLTEAEDSVIWTFRNYLDRSLQSESEFHLSFDPQNLNRSFGLWVEKLPNTDVAEFRQFASRFKTPNFFSDSFAKSDDPDVIINHLFPEGIKILAVTKPKLSCSCNKQRILNGLATLSEAELVDMFMDGQGIETQCDYCHKIWSVSDEDVQDLIKGSSSVH